MISISIIVPVYNVEEYLDRAFESIISQSFKDFEILIIDDGSTDSSGKISDSLKKKYPTFTRVFHNKNNGVSYTRNFGINVALGKYIFFMDPDDYIESNFLCELFQEITSKKAQIVIAGFTNVYPKINGKVYKRPVSLRNIFYHKEDFRNNFYFYLNNTTLAVPWNKLYEREYLIRNKILFKKVEMEDLYFNSDVVKDISRVSIINNIDYQYFRNNANSQMNRISDLNFFRFRKNQFLYSLSVYKSWKLNDKKSDSRVYYFFACRIIECIQLLSFSNTLSFTRKLSEIKKILDDPISIEALSKSESNSVFLNLIISIFKMKSAPLAFFVSFIISIIRKDFSSLFLNIKLKIMKA